MIFKECRHLIFNKNQENFKFSKDFKTEKDHLKISKGVRGSNLHFKKVLDT